MKEIIDIIRKWERDRGQPVALATLVRAQGSSYRRPGARMLICPDGSTAGSLSGGCLEEEVVRRAFDVLRTGVPSLMKFDTRLRFGCNGTIEVFVESVSEEFLTEVAAKMEERRTCHIVTVFAGDERDLGSRILQAEECSPSGAFVQAVQPPIQLIIFGDGPDSSPLRSFAELLGWRVFELEHTEDLHLLMSMDERTSAVVKSHNYGRDFVALRYLLQLGLRYVGLLGPRQRRDQLLNALLEAGVAIDSELFAPAGFDLGAETPEEIALAIVSEMQSVFAEASGESLRNRRAPIHERNLPRTPALAPIEECAA
jgi:xanthine/CO dehydrogenase XdhC/CoxF family maturation factor